MNLVYRLKTSFAMCSHWVSLHFESSCYLSTNYLLWKVTFQEILLSFYPDNKDYLKIESRVLARKKVKRGGVEIEVYLWFSDHIKESLPQKEVGGPLSRFG